MPISTRSDAPPPPPPLKPPFEEGVPPDRRLREEGDGGTGGDARCEGDCGGSRPLEVELEPAAAALEAPPDVPPPPSLSGVDDNDAAALATFGVLRNCDAHGGGPELATNFLDLAGVRGGVQATAVADAANAESTDGDRHLLPPPLPLPPSPVSASSGSLLSLVPPSAATTTAPFLAAQIFFATILTRALHSFSKSRGGPPADESPLPAIIGGLEAPPVPPDRNEPPPLRGVLG
mmetsp:Transcript_28898/g.85395  ORF Transcript_28898/g.85395 Transcript_28898/m.85395 type:complete len:234 (+) Transcript_28898:814-1515(+)